MASEFLAVMYHFVADAENTPWPGLISRRTEEFKGQIDYLCRNYEPVTVADVRAYCLEGRSLPSRAFLLTFDHGTRDHLDNVLPELVRRGLQGAFFVYTQVQEEGRICGIDKQRYLEYVFSDYHDLLRKFCGHALRLCPTLDRRAVEPSCENLVRAREYLSEYTFYSDEERFFRKVRDTVLPAGVFEEVVSSMFLEAFGDEASFARRHYLSWKDLAVMHGAGMEIGGHGHRHVPLARVDPDRQREEIAGNARLLRERVGVQAATFAFANGGYDAHTLAALSREGIDVAFSTNPKTGLRREAPLEIGRVDTNGLPTGG